MKTPGRKTKSSSTPMARLANGMLDTIADYADEHHGFAQRLADKMTELCSTGRKKKVWSRQQISLMLTRNLDNRVQPAYGTGCMLKMAFAVLKAAAKGKTIRLLEPRLMDDSKARLNGCLKKNILAKELLP